ncbi:MAG: M14 family zinc carboxypeptidase, partial [Gemmatimonadales bacterium]
MSRIFGSVGRGALALAVFGVPLAAPALIAQGPARKVVVPPSPQPNDVEYTAKIKEYLSDPRISTELVDHLPASATVPTPLKFLGRIIGTPGELTHAKDIHAYMRAIAKASPRAKVWSIGTTEEGREMIIMAIADEKTIATLDRYKGYLRELTDPRKTTEARAQQILHVAKPIYWITSGMHSPESGGPEMLMELAYRLVVEESPLIRNIRNNEITFITPVVEVDGREKMVDTYYYNKKYGQNGRLPLMYWGKYVQHDNNRDEMGQYLKLTQNITRAFLEWRPPFLHDLHEAQTYLYTSTGSGPYNEQLDPITIDEWWSLAETDIMEMTKRGVPGVWTYGFYDGWVPNYMFFVAHAHNATGRFYEVQSYGPDTTTVTPGATTTSREWFRPNPPLATIKWSPRANTNIQESAMLFTLDRVARDREFFLSNYWIKSKNSVNKGRKGPVFGWVIPAGQHARENAAEAVNELLHQGLEFHTATSAFRAGAVQVQPGDYIVRADQPYRTLADMYFSLQNFAPDNPSPYDDTGWTFPLLRNVTVTAITDSSLLDAPMTPVTADVRAPGGVSGSGNVVLVGNDGDNTLVSFRFRLAQVKMQAAEAAFDADGHHFGAGSFIIANADRAQLEPVLRELGLAAWAVSAVPAVHSHDLAVPRIGYVHSWQRTQDEGWVRAAFDYYGVPYTYFGEPVLKSGNLRAKYDVIVYPHGGSGVGAAGGGRGGPAGGRGGAPGSDSGRVARGATPKPIPYRRTAEFPSLGYPDSTDDITGGAGQEGMKALYEFVQQGGTLITEGNTAGIFPNLELTPGLKVETPQGPFAAGTIVRGVITDPRSPLVYGYEYGEVPVYFNSGPVLNSGQPPAAAIEVPTAAGGRGRGYSQNITPMAAPNRVQLSPWDPAHTGTPYGALPADTAVARGGRGRAGPGGGGGFGGGGRGAG